MTIFFVYAAQVLEVLSSETDSLSPTEQSGVSFEKRESDSLIISLRLNSREKTVRLGSFHAMHDFSASERLRAEQLAAGMSAPKATFSSAPAFGQS